jgi:hypothetical protein
MFKSFWILGDDLEKIPIDIIGAHVPETKNYYTWQISTTGCKKITKVEVMS